MGIYSSNYPEALGPIRSARISDLSILGEYGRVGFLYSGAQSKMRPVIAEANLINLSAERNPPSIYFNDPSRRSPYSMMVKPNLLLEMRLDNIVFRLGIAPTIPAARQLVSHGHICVESKRISIPSYQCQAGETISIRVNPRSKQLVESYLAFPGLANIPSHLEFDKNNLKGKINGIIERDWVALQLNELLIVEYYSRKG